MTDRFELPKLFLGTLVAVAVILFTVIGIQTTWSTYVVKDYNKHLTEQVYVDAAVNQNVNLVFYRNGCPYCKAGKKAVINSAEKSSYPTFYIDVESEDGQILIEKYHVDKAATLVTIRDGKFELFLYATKDKAGKIRADKKAIKEALNDYNS
ncbi:thioredoxin [Streptococcus agalactiae]|uniref:thioredoxin n=1 Tax=Streptococcus agalactiae TaxID=1311 RepID=UPI00085C9F66|nr:thioredoxin [Streptococcus agalactiae]